jgi:D-beta-D-heptose 7-phosphate kinase/D-beta-D-heptose 1-phosphate adenosyltransferase
VSEVNPINILVIGEICYDRWVLGSATRLCPEAPVAVLNPTKTTENFGMAGNVRANLLSLGADRVDLVCQLKSIIKTRYVDAQSGQMILRVDENDVAESVDETWLEQKLRSEQWSAVVISSYAKGFLPNRTVTNIAEYCKEAGIPTFMDTKAILGEWSKDIDIVKINSKEYGEHIKAGVMSPQDFCGTLIVTLGDKGARITGKDGKPDVMVAVDSIEVSSVAGAGDTFLSALALYLAKYKGSELFEAVDYACMAARIAVSKRGVVAVKAEEVV